MIVSEARIAANRANANKSTGPRTPEGKGRSRNNSLKHGLRASAVVPETIEQVQGRSALWYRALRPQGDAQVWLVDRVAVLSVRIDRCERMGRRARDKVSLRAELSWDDDRRLEAEALGVQPGRRPGPNPVDRVGIVIHAQPSRDRPIPADRSHPRAPIEPTREALHPNSPPANYIRAAPTV